MSMFIQGGANMNTTIPIYPELPKTGYLRITQVLRFIPIGRSTWWQGVKDQRFPQPIKLGPKTTVWRAEDIQQLLDDLNNNQATNSQ